MNVINNTLMARQIKLLTLILLCLFFTRVYVCAADKASAMIFSVECIEGVEKITINKTNEKAVLMKELKEGDVLQIPDGMEIILLFYNDRHKEKIKGKSTVKISNDGAQIIQGNKDSKSIISKNSLFLFPGNKYVKESEFGGTVTKSIIPVDILNVDRFNPVLIYPDIKTSTPRFNWVDTEGLGVFNFEIMTLKDENPCKIIVSRQKIKDNYFQYTDTLPKLMPGIKYFCQVVYKGNEFSQEEESSSCVFSILSATQIYKIKLTKGIWDILIKEDPENPDLYSLMAQFYIDNNLYFEALPLLEKLHKLMPREKEVYKKLAITYLKTGNINEADLWEDYYYDFKKIPNN